MEKLTLDEAVAQFYRLLREAWGPQLESCSYGPEAPEITEARYFRWAEALIGVACPEPADCANRRCRRSGRCRHLADLAARKEGPPRRQEDDRPPATHALRHAIWVYMNAQLALANATPSKT